MGAGAAEVDASAGSLAVRAPLLAGEAVTAVVAFVDGLFAPRPPGWQGRSGYRCAASSAAGGLSAGGAAVLLVGAAG